MARSAHTATASIAGVPAGFADTQALLGRLRRAQVSLQNAPSLVRAVVSSLVAAGRAYAATAEGAREREQILRSAAYPRVRALWDALRLDGYVSERSDGFGADEWVSLFATAARTPEAPDVLSRSAERAGAERGRR